VLPSQLPNGQAYASGLLAATLPASGPTLRTPRWLDPSTVVTKMQTGHGWLGSAGAVLNDTSDFVIGAQSAKMPTPGDGGTYKLEKTGLSIDTTGAQLRIRIKLENTAHINTWRFLIGNDTGYAASYSWDLLLAGDSTTAYVTEGDWLAITLPFSSATTTGSPTRTGIVAMKLNTRDDATAGVTAHLQSVELVTEPSATFANGLVSLCFDDNFDSVWLKAKPTMDANNLRGSIFLIDDLIDQSGRLTTAQLLTMQDQGWEICAHSHTNADHTSTYTGLTAAQLDADLHAQAAYLRTIGYRGQGIAYPQGVFGSTSDAQKTIPYNRKYATYGRTVHRRTMETFPPADVMRLRSQSAITTFTGGYAPTSVSGTNGDLDKAKAAHAWFIATFHKVVASGPAATTEIAQADFDAIIAKIVSNSMTCAPIGEVLAYYG
jgi:hypothetical protein